MRIALVGPGIMPIPPTGYGAVEKHIDKLASELIRNGHEVEVLNDVIGEYGWAIRVGHVLVSKDVEIVHSHTSFLGGYLTRFVREQTYVYTSHCPHWTSKNLGPREHWGMIWERNAVRYAKAVIALSSSQERAMSGLRTRGVWEIPNGVDCHMFHRRTGRTGTKVCMLGKVIPRKRVHVVAQAVHGQAELHVIGPTPDRGYVKQILKINPDVTFHSGLTEIQVAEKLGTMDVFVQASESEAMSMAVLEAMASELPIVQSPASLDTVGPTGLLVTDDSNPEAYTTVINRLLQDDQLNEYMAMAARLRAERLYSWETVAKRVQEVYATSLDLPS